jgi:NitT/TauT family transport system substrate-binding protein
MTDDLIAHGIAAMKRHGVVDSGDALELGVGAMTDARWRRFTDMVVQGGLYPRDIDLARAYTLQFVNRKVGASLKR